jgi:hypothetical protein
MSFSYTPAAVNDLTRVRFHTGDTVETESWLSDEEINMLLAEEGTWQKATIAALKFIISKLSKPDFQADWLRVSNASAREGFVRLLNEKRAEFGIPAISSAAKPVYRSDSLQTEPPDSW